MCPGFAAARSRAPTSLSTLGDSSVGSSSAASSSTAYLLHSHPLGLLVNADSLSMQDKDKIGMYEVIKTLGTGYFGSVKLAIHRPTRELVALKGLRRSQFEKLKIQYPPRELSLLSSLRHPNLALLYDVIDSGSCIYLVMEYVAGVELAEYVARQGKLCTSETRLIMRQLLNAIDYLHNVAHVCHRDLVSFVLFTCHHVATAVHSAPHPRNWRIS